MENVFATWRGGGGGQSKIAESIPASRLPCPQTILRALCQLLRANWGSKMVYNSGYPDWGRGREPGYGESAGSSGRWWSLRIARGKL